MVQPSARALHSTSELDADLVIDCEEDRTLRAVLDGMLREVEASQPRTRAARRSGGPAYPKNGAPRRKLSYPADAGWSTIPPDVYI